MVRFGDTILNILGNYKRCLGILIKIDKKFLAFSLFSTVLLGITPSISLLLTQSIINGIQTGVYSFSQVVGLIIVYVACNALVSLFTIFSQYYTSVFQYKLNKTINIMILSPLKIRKLITKFKELRQVTKYIHLFHIYFQ